MSAANSSLAHQDSPGSERPGPALQVQGVRKTFRIPHERTTTLAERVLSVFRPGSYEPLEVLRGVDLVVPHGSCLGIIGRNGAGKSTLLRVMCGILLPDGGSVSVDGTICEILELGLGFSLELTVREHVELYACVLGYPRADLHARVDAAIRFAELERFRDAKLKNLSTGMVMRLGFSTALQADTDILLLDEITSVGDRAFQHKCLETFADLRRRTKTVVLVSHDMEQVRRFCTQAVLLEGGKVLANGAPDPVIARYEDLIRQPAQETVPDRILRERRISWPA